MAGTSRTQEPAVDSRVDDLLQRVERLEKAYEGMLSGKVAEISQEERDRITLSRRPNSYQEAVEFEAAQKRQAERDRERPGKSAEGEAPAPTGDGK